VWFVVVCTASACLAPRPARAAGPSVAIGTIGAGGLASDPAAAPTPHARENAHRAVVVTTPAPPRAPIGVPRPGLPPDGVVVIVPNVVPGLGGRPPWPPPAPPGTLHRWSDDPWRR